MRMKPAEIVSAEHVNSFSLGAPPPFDGLDVSELVHWLNGRGIRGYFAAGSEAATDTGSESRYLRTTLYLDKAEVEHELGEVSRATSERRWYDLAVLLEGMLAVPAEKTEERAQPPSVQ